MKRCILLCLCLLALVLTGCSLGRTTRGDIEKHLLDAHTLGHFRVSREYQEVPGYGDELNRLWTVTLTEQADVTFQVLEDRYDPQDVYLSDNYEDTMLMRLADSYGQLEKLELVEYSDQGLARAKLHAAYSSRADLVALFDEIFAFRDYVEASGYNEDFSMAVQLQLDVPLRSVLDSEELLDSYTMTDGDIYTHVTDCGEFELEYALEQFIQTCTDYQLEEPLLDFEQHEIDAAVATSWDRILVYPDASDPIAIEGATGNWDGVSFGSLYKVLQQTGFNPAGTSQHYSFIAADGCLYEISYDFYEFNPDTSWLENAFYYLRDGEKIWMQDPPSVHFDEETVSAMLGIEVTIDDIIE